MCVLFFFAQQIAGDSVGFGFVVRGDGPSYVHTVDPGGPAAAAGLKVRTNMPRFCFNFLLPETLYTISVIGAFVSKRS